MNEKRIQKFEMNRYIVLFYGVFSMLTSFTLFHNANYVDYTHYSLFTCIYFVWCH